jgi:hypothetical protein
MVNQKNKQLNKIIKKIEKERIPTLEDIKRENTKLTKEEVSFQKKFKLKDAKKRKK